jgi:hypothetical protein
MIQHGRVEKLIEVRGTSGAGSAGYRYALTDLGRERAMQFMDINRYVGPAPVPLTHYTAYTRAAMQARPWVDRGRLSTGFGHLIVGDGMLDSLGPAVNSGKALFLYGAPGNGKTVVAEGIGRALGSDMHVPHAVDVDGQTITMFDPVNHVPAASAGASNSVVSLAMHDRRWESIRRPVVVVGGELTLEMLDLSFNPISKFYEAPIQMKAIGGVFVVDDFGRQRIPPRDLLNRWIVPLESRVDYLTLHTGKKFQIPFDVLTVFATNLDPLSLADEAFLRRIPYKIEIEDPTLQQYARIFEMICDKRNLKFHPVMVAYLHRRHYRPISRPLRACQPRDLIEQVTALCNYRGEEPRITRELLDAACAAYFVDDTTGSTNSRLRRRDAPGQ